MEASFYMVILACYNHFSFGIEINAEGMTVL